MVHDFAEVEQIRARLGEAGITSVFVPGGDADPVGVYPDSFSLLEDLNKLESPFAHVGIAGYPETHPKIHDDLTVQAMWDKRRHATHIVSNLTFDAGAVKAWVERMRARGITQPLLLGLPGPIDRAKLLTMAGKIGVGESTRFLTKNAGFFARLAAPGGWTGQKFLEDCAPVAMKPESLVEGLHVFTFNQVAETEAWRQQLLSQL
jgi:methylenetetrahydrofolate reductase (NADPH)